MRTSRKTKKYKVKVRVKIRKHRIQRILTFITGIIVVVGLFYYGSFLFRFISGQIDRKILAWKVLSVKVLTDNEEIKNKIFNDLKNKIGVEFNKKECQNLAAQIKTKYQCIKDLKVSRNFLTKTLVLKPLLHKTVANVKLMDGQRAYLTESGKIINEPCGEINHENVKVNLLSKVREDLKYLVGFVREINSNRNAFVIQPESINCIHKEEDTPRSETVPVLDCTLKLQNGFEVTWGEFELTQSKILRLNYILNDIKDDKIFKIDLRYFKNGRIFVSEK